MGIGGDLNIGGTVTATSVVVLNQLILNPINAPQYSTSPGVFGQIAYGSTAPNVNYLYICTATNQWSRIQITDTGPW